MCIFVRLLIGRSSGLADDGNALPPVTDSRQRSSSGSVLSCAVMGRSRDQLHEVRVCLVEREDMVTSAFSTFRVARPETFGGAVMTAATRTSTIFCSASRPRLSVASAASASLRIGSPAAASRAFCVRAVSALRRSSSCSFRAAACASSSCRCASAASRRSSSNAARLASSALRFCSAVQTPRTREIRAASA